MPTVALSPYFTASQQFSNVGGVLAGGKLFSYKSGTATPATTYADSAGVTVNSNPIILDSSGRLSDEIWLVQGDLYKFVLTDASNVQIGTWENIYAVQSYYPSTTTEVSEGVTPVNYAFAPGNVLRYGSNLVPGITNMKPAVQNCLDCNPYCYFPPGTYRIESTVNVGAGQSVYGDHQSVVTVLSPASTVTFKWQLPAIAGDKAGPRYHDLRIESDFPIVINDTATFIADGEGDAPCVRAEMYNLYLQAVTTGEKIGQGITANKLFDSLIRNNYIGEYRDGIILHGCDINEVRNNRIIFFSRYGILEQSAQTLGSQNDLTHNDILASRAPSSGPKPIYIKSCSRHVSIINNYLEQAANALNVDVETFVDLSVSSITSPSFGSNVATPPLSIVVRDNRIDGEGFSTHVYKIDPTEAVTIICDNRNTTGDPNIPHDSKSEFTTSVKARYNEFHARNIRIAGDSWGIWDGFDSVGPNTGSMCGFVVNGTNIPAIINKDQNANVIIRGGLIVIPLGFEGIAHIVPGQSSVNSLFANGQNYIVTIVVRSNGIVQIPNQDKLEIAMGSSSHGDNQNVFELTNQFKRFSWTFVGKPSSYLNMGAYLSRPGQQFGDIEILSLSWEMQ